jgi:hypothetical protein
MCSCCPGVPVNNPVTVCYQSRYSILIPSSVPCLFRRASKTISKRDSFIVSVRMEERRCHWTDFCEILYWRICVDTCRLDLVLVRIRQKQEDTLYELWPNFLIMSRKILLVLKRDSEKRCRTIKTHFALNVFYRKSCTLYELTTKNAAQREGGRERVAKEIVHHLSMMWRHMHAICMLGN